VLKQYGANVDAMLGLGAIAARQGRLADADGWYRKVLELEPRNEVAKGGMLSIQQAGRPQVNESQIKSLLAASPNDANLHAALGDLYAGQLNWPAAQQAYFEAYRVNPTAENAFNLGVSLDQLGKSTIALPYYQEALQKADQSSLIDTAALEARISSIQ
jgi:tetratricopeptide (TPR) repeat protein